jgi:hypothetical protein
MYRLTISLVIFALPAGASDFRSIDIGQTCNIVDAWEMAHGSTRNITHADSGLEVYSYNVEEFGRRVIVRYFCHYGKFFSGHFDFPREPWLQAVETYRNTYNSLRSIHGAPSTEDHPSDDIDNKARSPNHWTTHISVWKDSKANTVLSIVPSQPSKPELDQWHVLIEVHGHATHFDGLTIGQTDRRS